MNKEEIQSKLATDILAAQTQYDESLAKLREDAYAKETALKDRLLEDMQSLQEAAQAELDEAK